MKKVVLLLIFIILLDFSIILIFLKSRISNVDSNFACPDGSIHGSGMPADVNQWCAVNGYTALVNEEGSDKFVCGILERNIKQDLQKLDISCKESSDCKVLDLELSCPFGCYVVGNRDADVSEIEKSLIQYEDKHCTSCAYKCRSMPDAKDIRCIDNRCVDNRTFKSL